MHAASAMCCSTVFLSIPYLVIQLHVADIQVLFIALTHIVSNIEYKVTKCTIQMLKLEVLNQMLNSCSQIQLRLTWICCRSIS